ncbi:MAG TPA: tRNA lysidine(34) synthetase TilS, partial [Chromatiaceae bacterium]|nr:tRNA lysidine(34) synthetase TilS [Chromatiaceae bacterium]
MVEIRADLGLPLRAVHVDHGLHADSSQWSKHCRLLCRELGIPLVELEVDIVPTARTSLEELAREARYRAISAILQHGEMLLLAQHGDDQVETFLLQLLRGAGVAGLAAMPAVRPWQGGWMARPLLEFTRRELKDWANEEKLNWIEDPSNQDIRMARNYLRREVIPDLRRRWPGLVGTIGRSAAHCGEAAQILREVAEADLEKSSPSPWQLSLSALQTLSRARQRNLVRYWVRSRGICVPTRKALESLLEQGTAAGEGAAPHLSWKGGEMRRYRDRLYLFPEALPELPQDVRLSWSGYDPLILPEGLGTL